MAVNFFKRQNCVKLKATKFEKEEKINKNDLYNKENICLPLITIDIK